LISPVEFINLVRDQVRRVIPDPETIARYRYATVITTIPLCVQFDGDPAANTVPLKALSSYSATIADRVLCLKTGSSYVVQGKVI
jgi:ABC-type sulfate transport system substrate-binding protein